MTTPTPTLPDPGITAPPAATKATKAIVASLTTITTWFTAVGVALSDGHLSWTEAGGLLAAAAGAVATVYGVWRVPNEPKP